MESDVWKDFEGKHVYVNLKNNRKYSGTVVSVDDAGNGLIFITIIDKNGSRVIFAAGEISNLEEQEENSKKETGSFYQSWGIKMKTQTEKAIIIVCILAIKIKEDWWGKEDDRLLFT